VLVNDSYPEASGVPGATNPDRTAFEENLALIWGNVARQYFYEGGLASSILAQDRVHRRPVKGQADIIQRYGSIIGLAQLPKLEYRYHPARRR
jgi:hypothetical protein